jgi:thiol-disulfide isomerase/thioredoxin
MIVPRISSVILLLFVILQAAEKTTILQPSSPAPTFSLPTLSQDRISLRVYCGEKLQKPHINNIRHIIVISFWATYCKPCKKEMPELMKFAAKHKGDSIKVFCISIDKEGASIVTPFVKEQGYTLPILLDPYRKTAERYGVRSLPALFVIDGRGIIRYSSVGYHENDPLDVKLEGIITSIRQGKEIAPNTPEQQGEMVDVENASTQSEKTAYVLPKNRWDAIVAVECGMSLEKLADSLKVTPQDIKSWYTDLKKAAIKLWEKDTLK